MAKLSQTELLEQLLYFTGTTQWYHLPGMKQYTYTDGVRFLAQQAGAYWLLEHIFLHQSDEKINKEPFQNWKIVVNDDNSATITVDEGNGKVLKTFNIPFTDFPIKEYEMYFIDNVLLLKGEY